MVLGGTRFTTSFKYLHEKYTQGIQSRDPGGFEMDVALPSNDSSAFGPNTDQKGRTSVEQN